MEPIGVIRSPFTEIAGMPIQPKGATDVEGKVIIEPEYVEGLSDIEGFSHIYLIYSFHLAKRTALSVIPFMDKVQRGVFSTRSPLRPNHIGLSIVELLARQGHELRVRGVDVVDGTPLLDIKPYIKEFDAVKESRSGWLDACDEEITSKRSDSRFK